MNYEQPSLSVVDDLVEEDLQRQLTALIQSPIWAYGWRSNLQGDRFAYWHSHFAGSTQSRANCLHQLRQEPLLAPVFHLWQRLQTGVLAGHEPFLVYANAHTYGVEGYVHRDSLDTKNYFSTVYYAHPTWDKNWGGDTVFYNDTEDDIIRAVFPRPGRTVSFPGAMPHCARAPSRDCSQLRVSIVFKTQINGACLG